ncbi:MAG: cation diffusion facilitator family transporter [Bacillota bacterium]
MSEQKRVERTAIAMLGLNGALALVKGLAGYFGASLALMAEAVHSSVDILTSSGVLFGVKISNKPPDTSHPYGHGKIESVIACGISLILAYAGVSFMKESLLALKGLREPPTVMPLITAGVCLLIKEGMFRYTSRVARSSRSMALNADAWHHRADVYITAGVFTGILGARAGFPLLDPAASMLVASLILLTAYRICRMALDQLLDASVDSDTLQIAEKAVLARDGVSRVDFVAARRYGQYLYFDIGISVDNDLSVEEGHNVATSAKRSLYSLIPRVSGVLIHVNPSRDQLDRTVREDLVGSG